MNRSIIEGRSRNLRIFAEAQIGRVLEQVEKEMARPIWSGYPTQLARLGIEQLAEARDSVARALAIVDQELPKIIAAEAALTAAQRALIDADALYHLGTLDAKQAVKLQEARTVASCALFARTALDKQSPIVAEGALDRALAPQASRLAEVRLSLEGLRLNCTPAVNHGDQALARHVPPERVLSVLQDKWTQTTDMWPTVAVVAIVEAGQYRAEHPSFKGRTINRGGNRNRESAPLVPDEVAKLYRALLGSFEIHLRKLGTLVENAKEAQAALPRVGS